VGQWLAGRAGELSRDRSPFGNDMEVAGSGVGLGVAGPSGSKGAVSFDGRGWLGAPAQGQLRFAPDESFTIDCAIATQSRDIRVAASRSGAYCVYVKNGRLAAWIMADGAVYAEALGNAEVADGAWHRVTAVFDREKQELSLYLDGKLDTAGGTPSAANPAGIGGIGLSTSDAAFSIGSLDGSFPFIGSISNVAAWRGALPPGDPRRSVPEARGSASGFAPSGVYTSTVSDWGQVSRVTRLAAECALRGGRGEALIEVSDDGFRSVAGRRLIALDDGRRSYDIAELPPARHARIRLRLHAAPNGTESPQVTAVRLDARPAT
jgi:hypothetical protein